MMPEQNERPLFPTPARLAVRAQSRPTSLGFDLGSAPPIWHADDAWPSVVIDREDGTTEADDRRDAGWPAGRSPPR